MAYSLRDVPRLARSPIGRIQILRGIQVRSAPALIPIATLYRRTLIHRARVVAVTGSFGKSTTTRAVACALGVTLHHRFTYNISSGVALALLRIRPLHRHGVIETAINGRGQMAPMARMVRPDIAVVTSIGSEHHRSLGTLETTRDEKAYLVRVLSSTGTAILNGDDPHVRWMASQTQARIVTFGFDEHNDVRATDVRLDWPHGTRFSLHAGDRTHEVTVKLIGRHALYPILAAAAVSHVEGVPIERAIASLAQLTPTPGRMQPVALADDIWILRDDFKAATETIEAALDALAQIPAKRRVIAIGNMTEPIGGSRRAYRAIGRALAAVISAGVVIGSRESFHRYVTGAVQGGLDRAGLQPAGRSVLDAVRILRGMLEPGDVLLVKGGGRQHLERITFALQGRDVRCDLRTCEVKIPCNECPMLERGWHGGPQEPAEP